MSRPKHVVLLTKTLADNQLVVFLTSWHCTFMLYTQRGCLNSRSPLEKNLQWKGRKGLLQRTLSRKPF